jgi:hypothetical protein
MAPGTPRTMRVADGRMFERDTSGTGHHMTDQEKRELRKLLWKHLGAEEFPQAEVAVRRLIDVAGPDDALELWNLYGVLASTLNSLARPAEATGMFDRALQEARKTGPSNSAIDVARYMLANQHLIYGDPSLALAECSPIPPGVGHVQCLLRAVAAEALWKLDRRSEAQDAARAAIDASPTDERRTALSDQLGYILGVG